MNAPAYLDVRYGEAERPYTSYPYALTSYLTERFLGGHREGRLLDLGSGRGEFLNGFARLGFVVRGVDRCRPSAPRFSEPVSVCDWEKESLPFVAGSFDVIFTKSVLEHSLDVTRLLEECDRVLAPGGRMIHLVPDWRAQWRHFYDDWTHVRPFTLTGLSECLKSHGFSLLTAERFRQLPFLWERPYLAPIAHAAALLPAALKSRSKLVRFSKEWMLLAVADKAPGR